MAVKVDAARRRNSVRLRVEVCRIKVTAILGAKHVDRAATSLFYSEPFGRVFVSFENAVTSGQVVERNDRQGRRARRERLVVEVLHWTSCLLFIQTLLAKGHYGLRVSGGG